MQKLKKRRTIRKRLEGEIQFHILKLQNQRRVKQKTPTILLKKKTTCRQLHLEIQIQKRRGSPSSIALLHFKSSLNIAWSKFREEMELGTLSDPSQSTFSLIDEYHTFANAIRFTLNQDPRTRFCGYSIPHPSDNRVNIRIQTTGIKSSRWWGSCSCNIQSTYPHINCDPAKDVFRDACQDLMVMCQHVSNTFDKAVVDFKMSKSVDGMDVESNS